MQSTTLDLSADIIDVRDIIARVEELETELKQRHEEGAFMSDFPNWIDNSRDNSNPIHAAFGDEGADVQSQIEEFFVLRAILTELEGMGGDEDWRGAWYPLTLIRDSYFRTYAEELADDCGLVPKDAKWPMNCIDWEQAARELQWDYSSVDIDGVTYWTR